MLLDFGFSFFKRVRQKHQVRSMFEIQLSNDTEKPFRLWIGPRSRNSIWRVIRTIVTITTATTRKIMAYERKCRSLQFFSRHFVMCQFRIKNEYWRNNNVLAINILQMCRLEIELNTRLRQMRESLPLSPPHTHPQMTPLRVTLLLTACKQTLVS